ncbi:MULTISPECIES: EamA family transporter RarD [unclassified Marinobacterium]|uniref:EamA family transporter RarD n=1 Tax=unclassified Marinobacterium TaxID=2644139 RepID=UPI00156A0EA5|nr:MULTISPECIES: EamA family transporter RarD [unclassified Marinobacterium]NRP10447.1 EamA-like transporter family protein [Marinobacterium sp. xm-g-48]NRP82971.1 EamA-like transporter family protein [Marinobacterium sp. xm-d-509]NRP94224.1 EamA-like transporter family protein [Marinobacterium sp. xm-g-59]
MNQSIASQQDSHKEYRQGLFQGTLAYLIWGCFGLYFTLLAEVPADEVLAHRIVWCVLFVGLLILLQKKIRSTWTMLTSKKTLFWLSISSLLISGNWWIYIWAVGSGQVIAASLGYFLSPLVAVLLGLIFFKEQLNRLQKTSVFFASVGVLWQIVAIGEFPWIAVSLSLLFGFYGVVRKQIAVDSVSGLLIETLIMLPIALIYLSLLATQGVDHFGAFTWELIGAGVMTAVPLMLFASAARKLPLGTVGFLNYIAPIMQFLSAVFILNEAFGIDRFISFAFIWVGLIVFSVDLFRKAKANG